MLSNVLLLYGLFFCVFAFCVWCFYVVVCRLAVSVCCVCVVCDVVWRVDWFVIVVVHVLLCV